MVRIFSTCARIEHLSHVYKTSPISFADVKNHFSFMSYKIVTIFLGYFGCINLINAKGITNHIRPNFEKLRFVDCSFILKRNQLFEMESIACKANDLADIGCNKH